MNHFEEYAIRFVQQVGKKEGPISPVMINSASFGYGEHETGEGIFDSSVKKPLYLRMGNPTLAQLEQVLASMDGGVGATALATFHELDDVLSVKEPKKYHVFLLNDDYTSMDFVIDMLIGIFHKSYAQAHAVMMQVHQGGRGLCGTYSYEIAETKIAQVAQFARESGFPLKAIMEEAQ